MMAELRAGSAVNWIFAAVSSVAALSYLSRRSKKAEIQNSQTSQQQNSCRYLVGNSPSLEPSVGLLPVTENVSGEKNDTNPKGNRKYCRCQQLNNKQHAVDARLAIPWNLIVITICWTLGHKGSIDRLTPYSATDSFWNWSNWSENSVILKSAHSSGKPASPIRLFCFLFAEYLWSFMKRS
jgi:hypothetical protein